MRFWQSGNLEKYKCVLFWLHKGFQPSINISVMKGTRIYRLWWDVRKSPVKVLSHSQKAFIGKARSQVLFQNYHLIAAWKGIQAAGKTTSSRIPTSPPQTASPDSAVVATWLEKHPCVFGVCVRVVLDSGQGADRQWNVNVCMLTNSTALWMGFVITPHHACCIGLVPGPLIFLHLTLSLSSVFPLSHHGASWAIMWSHYLTPRCSRVQLTKTARGSSCGKDSVDTQHTFHPLLLPHYHQQTLTFSH